MAVELPEGATDAASEKENADKAPPAQVSILCYHDFSAKFEATEMRIRQEAFKEQMQAVKESGVNVITLADFILWKRGEKELPEKNVMITIDDGWRSVYIVAYPILKEYEFPFVLGLYKDFVGKGELALDKEMINEMLQNGMEISSHSVTHPFPSVVKKEREKGEDNYNAFLKKEFGASRGYLENEFKQDVITYIYPGGYYAEDMFPVLRLYGYEYAFTVKPGKVTRDSLDLEIPRYVVLGTTDHMFKRALQFKISNKYTFGSTSVPYPVKPIPNHAVSDRRPWIGVDLGEIDNIDRESIKMYVSGFGHVNGKFIPDTDRFEWQATRALRSPVYTVTVNWKIKGDSKYQDPVKWSFQVDHRSAYVKTAEGK